MSELIWPCPFCSLLCDEHLTRNSQGKLSCTETFECDKSKDGLNKFINNGQSTLEAMLDGEIIDYDLAVLEASKMIKKSKNPIICGLGVDVGGARSIVKLASRTNAIVDHKYGESISGTTTSLQTKGVFFTSLSEVKSRADLVVFIGNDMYGKSNCLYKKINKNDGVSKTKKFINYGNNFNTSDALIASLQNLSGFQKNENFSACTDYNKSFFDELSHFKYIVLVWDPANYSRDADAIADVLLEIIRDLNTKNRGGILTLSGDEGAITMQSVMSWMTGLPLRTAFTTRGLVHDPNKFSSKKIIQQNASDLVIWVSCFNTEIPDYVMNTKQPLIIFGHYAISKFLHLQNLNNYIFIPVATPGLDVDGHLIRCDSVVTVPLKKIVGSPLPSLQNVVARIL